MKNKKNAIIIIIVAVIVIAAGVIGYLLTSNGSKDEGTTTSTTTTTVTQEAETTTTTTTTTTTETTAKEETTEGTTESTTKKKPTKLKGITDFDLKSYNVDGEYAGITIDIQCDDDCDGYEIEYIGEFVDQTSKEKFPADTKSFYYTGQDHPAVMNIRSFVEDENGKTKYSEWKEIYTWELEAKNSQGKISNSKMESIISDKAELKPFN